MASYKIQDMIGLNMKDKVFSETQVNKKIDDNFFNLYDKYGTALYRIICMWIEDKAIAKEFLFKSFMQVHREFCKEQPVKEPAFEWILQISRSVCLDLAQEMGIKMNHTINPD